MIYYNIVMDLVLMYITSIEHMCAYCTYVHANIFNYIPNATCPQLLCYTRHASVELQ